MNILAIGAHPDDIELGCGGTMSYLKKKGSTIHFIVFTEGEKSYNVHTKNRMKEQLESCKVLNVDNLIQLGVKDGYIQQSPELISKLEKYIIDHEIDVVFVNHGNDTHQDHRELYNIARVASRNCENVLLYETLTTYDFRPHIYIDISNDLNKKVDSLKCFKSEIDKYQTRNVDLIERVKLKSRLFGTAIQCEHAEGFRAEKLELSKLI